MANLSVLGAKSNSYDLYEYLEMWKQKIQILTNDCEFSSPATSTNIAASEQLLSIQFPENLRSLLLESNGIIGQYGLGLIWPLERIETENLSFRNNDSFRDLYMPFDHLLFFADAGNGDQFAFSIQSGEIRRPDVFAWNHENDSRTWVASTLDQYLEWWLSGKIKL